MNGFSFSDLFQFERMVAPKLLKLVYWIGLAGIALYSLFTLMGGLGMMSYNAGAGFGLIIAAILGGLFGILFWRVVIELYMVAFGIFDRLGEVRDSLVKSPPQAEGPDGKTI